MSAGRGTLNAAIRRVEDRRAERVIPAQDVAHQLGHTDGGALVQRLYGHPSERLARERIKRATAGKPSAVVSLPDAGQDQP